jgi:hypothetical protein
MKRFGVFFATFALLMSAGLVSADSLGIGFEPAEGYEPGSIDGQEGWAGSGGLPILPTIDQEIVTNVDAPASFGTQSWRFSNAHADGQFALWPFSPSLDEEAGETDAEGGLFSSGPRQSHFEVEWDFASFTQAPQTGLQMSTAPDRGDGARMSFIRLEDLPDGMSVDFAEYIDNAPFGESLGDPRGCGVEDEFRETVLATGLSRDAAHTVKLTMDFVDGTRNDIVKVYVNGVLEHTGTSWEDYFRYCEGNPPRTVDSMIFQARNLAAPLLNGQGFLLDNLSYASSQAPVSLDDCKNGGWEDRTRADGSAFKNQGDCIQYVNTGR